MNEHKIPILGAAGASIYAALHRLHLYADEDTVTITKRRVETGGYVYVVSHLKKG